MRTFTLAVLAVALSVAVPGAHAANYQRMSVRDFAIDAEALTRASAPVDITGAYALAGNLDQLYGAANDVVLAREGIASPPSIPLLIDHASRELRAAIFDCRSSGAYFCMITVRGVAEKCTLTNAFGVAHETACIAVEDGGNYRPPPLTPEQIAELKAQAAAAQQRHAAELAEQVNQWNQTVEDCLVNSPLAHPHSAVNLSAAYYISRLMQPGAAKKADADRKANAARQLYEACTGSHPWPTGAPVPAPLPDRIQQVIDQCMQSSHNWRFCTQNNPPHP